MQIVISKWTDMLGILLRINHVNISTVTKHTLANSMISIQTKHFCSGDELSRFIDIQNTRVRIQAVDACPKSKQVCPRVYEVTDHKSLKVYCITNCSAPVRHDAQLHTQTLIAQFIKSQFYRFDENDYTQE